MNLITIRPGPVVHVWRDGKEVAAVPLTPEAAISAASQILAAIPSAEERTALAASLGLPEAKAKSFPQQGGAV